MQQPGDSLHQLLLMLVDATIGVTDAPEHLDDRQLIQLRAIRDSAMREFVQRHCLVRTARGVDHQHIQRLVGQLEALL